MSPYTSALLDRLENPPIPKASPAELARLRDTAREIRAMLADRDDSGAPAEPAPRFTAEELRVDPLTEAMLAAESEWRMGL